MHLGSIPFPQPAIVPFTRGFGADPRPWGAAYHEGPADPQRAGGCTVPQKSRPHLAMSESCVRTWGLCAFFVLDRVSCSRAPRAVHFLRGSCALPHQGLSQKLLSRPHLFRPAPRLQQKTTLLVPVLCDSVKHRLPSRRPRAPSTCRRSSSGPRTGCSSWTTLWPPGGRRWR